MYLQDYMLEWGDGGLVIHVIDYHAGPLELSWEVIRGLARQAGTDLSEQSEAGSKRSAGLLKSWGRRSK
jgi:hypothetical protein